MTSASEQTSASKRKPGYYFVIKHEFSDWETARWTEGGFWCRFRDLRVYSDTDLREIDERRIIREEPEKS